MNRKLEGREALAYWIPWTFFFFVAAAVITFLVTRKKVREVSLRTASTAKALPSNEIEKSIAEEIKRRLT